MAKKEFKIGEIFQCGLVKLRCEKDKGVCEGCVFDSIDVMCDDFIFVTGHCASDKREDKTDVIFVKVDEE